MVGTVVLGIESSCDETGAGLVRDGRLLGQVLASSMDEHARFGGVVPEIAARAHLQAFAPVVGEALGRAGLGLDEVGAVAVTTGPGLSGALQVGAMIAAVGDLLVRAGAAPAPLDVSVDPSAPLEYAALHPVGRAAPAPV